MNQGCIALGFFHFGNTSQTNYDGSHQSDILNGEKRILKNIFERR